MSLPRYGIARMLASHRHLLIACILLSLPRELRLTHVGMVEIGKVCHGNLSIL